MFVVDAHCDSIQGVEERRASLVNPYNFSNKYPQLQLVADFCDWPGEDARASYVRMLKYVGAFSIAAEKERERVRIARSYADIERAFAEGKHAAMLTIEGGRGIVRFDKIKDENGKDKDVLNEQKSLEIFRDLYFYGVRVFGLAWQNNELAKSTHIYRDNGEDTGLSELGKRVVSAGNELGMIFDVSHLSDKSFWDVIELAKKPPVATHSNFRELCPNARNLDKKMAGALVERGGVIGLNLFPDFVHTEKEKQDIEGLFAHLDYCLENFGEDHVGFGGDVDGTSGRYPKGITTERSIHDQLIEFMIKHYDGRIVEKVAGLNFLNYLKKNLD